MILIQSHAFPPILPCKFPCLASVIVVPIFGGVDRARIYVIEQPTFRMCVFS